jgi:hypothetical protein
MPALTQLPARRYKPTIQRKKEEAMKQKLLSYVLILSTALTCAVVTPEAIAEKTRAKVSKTTTGKDRNQPGQLQITGTPGSPSATATINGKQLPVPDPKFGGVIKDDALNSTPLVGVAQCAA